MPERSDESAAQPSPASRRPRRRWLQISLRTLLLLIVLVALAALAASWYEAPYRRQREAMAAIEKAGGTYQASPAGPAWLRRLLGEDSFRNVTLVNVADCDDPAAYLDQVAGLPALETLAVGGLSFTDDHLQQLHGVTTLSGLVLDCTEVTDHGIAALHEALPQIEVYRSQRRGLAAIRRLGGNVPTQTNFEHPRLEKIVGHQWFDEATGRVFFADRGPLHDADLPLLKKLTTATALSIAGNQVTDEGLASVGKMTNLQGLRLTRLLAGDAGLAHLTALKHLAQLDLDQTNVTDAGLASLREMTRLRFLSLAQTRVSDVAIAQLADMRQLEGIDLSETQVTDGGLGQLKTLPELRSVYLNGTKVSDKGLVHLERLTQLTQLSLAETTVSDAGLPLLRGMSALVLLGLGGTRVTDAGMVHLRGFTRLTVLYLDHTQVGDAGLARLKELKEVRALYLKGTRVTDEGLRHLRHFPKLQGLDLRETQVTDGGLQHLRGVARLFDLRLPTKVSPGAIRELGRALPNCHIQQ